MSETTGATEFFNRWIAGDEDAARHLFEHYSQRLALLADKNISQRLSRRVDGEDIVQSVFRTFFQRSARGEFQIKDSAELWRLMVTITLAKVRSQARRHTSDKRDVNVEVSADDRYWLFESMTVEPGPVEAAALVDQIEAILAGLPAGYAEILAYRLEGHARTEIARSMGISRQTVHRALSLMQGRLKRQADDPPQENS
jgi:RNA polymerase sigma-70 factor (ECF subfamily)